MAQRGGYQRMQRGSRPEGRGGESIGVSAMPSKRLPPLGVLQTRFEPNQRYVVYARLEESVCDLLQETDELGLINGFANGPWLVDVISAESLVDAGSRKLSFQRVIIGLLKVITRPRLVHTLNQPGFAAILNRLHESNLSEDANPRFERKVVLNLLEMLNQDSFDDRNFESGNIKTRFVPRSWIDLGRPIVDYFVLIARKYPMDLVHPFYGMVNDVLARLARVEPKLQPDTDTFSKLLESTTGMIAKPVPYDKLKLNVKMSGRPLFGGPGRLRFVQADHLNDHEDFRQISIVPSVAELGSKCETFLPPKSLSAWHTYSDEDFVASQPQILREFLHIQDAVLLDINFRLFREDMVHQLREAFSQRDQTGISQSSPSPDKHLQVHQLGFVTKRGRRNFPFALAVILLCPRMSKPSVSKAEKDKSPWDGHFKRWFSYNSLVEIHHNNILDFRGVIVVRESKKDELTLVISPVDRDSQDGLLEMLQYIGTSNAVFTIRHVLNNFFVYRPILTALQAKSGLPFNGRLSSRQPLTSRLPKYVNETTRFNFRSVLKQGKRVSDATARYDLVRNGIPMNAEDFRLDPNQLEAVCKALKNDIGIIQGPPGTGKSYCGAAIAHILIDSFEEDPDFFPILCLCTTNHALDQFLVDLLDSSRTDLDIVRIGSQAKINERLRGFSLFEKVKKLPKMSKDWDRINFTKQKVGELQIKIESLVANIANGTPKWHLLQDYVARRFPAFYSFLEQMDRGGDILGDDSSEDFDDGESQDVEEDDTIAKEEDEGEFQEQGRRRPPPSDVLTKWASQGNRIPHETVDSEQFDLAMKNPELLGHDTLTYHQRQAVIKHLGELVLRDLIARYEEALTNERNERRMDDEMVLRKAKIIGMTTSKAAELQDILNIVAPKVVICEEAGEIFEPVLLAALSERTEHLILIGDHQQLRPKPNKYDLARASKQGYDLDVSTFERLVEEKILPSSMTTLTIQRRMRPEIADLLRVSLYPSLQDADNVTKYADMKGILRNVVFFSHQHLEKSKGKGSESFKDRSKLNEFEAEFAVRLSRYFLQQGCFSEEKGVVILTPYLGQLMRIRSILMEQRFDVVLGEQDQEDVEEAEAAEGSPGLPTVQGGKSKIVSSKLSERIRIATVDNFQGEEGDVIILSTVRNNSSNDLGFLRETNRVNVAISRARMGMVILGNASMLRESFRKCQMWIDVIDHLEKKGCVLDHLPLVCSRHPDKTRAVRTIADFPNHDGCDLPCNYRLDCGHPCQRTCHLDDLDHKLPCRRMCLKPCKAGLHGCKELCSELCKCIVDVGSKELPCGHMSRSLTCDMALDLGKVKCVEKLVQQLPCGHNVSYTCGTSVPRVCPKPCDAVLACDHPCPSMSHQRCDALGHSSSSARCGKEIGCEHGCSLTCGHQGFCLPCQKPCERSCTHKSQCPKKCSEPCPPCIELIFDTRCTHAPPSFERFPRPCSTPSYGWICDKPCENKLACGHPCPSVCGEPCPKPAVACKICASAKILDLCVDLVTMETYRDCAEPVIVPNCGHMVALSSCDGQMGMQYWRDPRTGFVSNPFAWASQTEWASMSDKIQSPYFKCAWCNKLDLTINRYRWLTALAELGKLEVNFQKFMDKRITDLCDRAEEALRISPLASTSREKQLKKVVGNIRRARNKDRSPIVRVFEALKGSALDRFNDEEADLDQCERRLIQLMDNNALDVDERWSCMLSLIEKVCSIQTMEQLQEFKTELDLAHEQTKSEIVVVDALSLLCVAAGNGLDDELQNQVSQLILARNYATDAGKKLKQHVFESESAAAFKLIEQEFKGHQGWYNSGHAFRCPNGHPYFIADCGGAMEESRCLDCDAVIGGTNHRLAAGNDPLRRLS